MTGFSPAESQLSAAKFVDGELIQAGMFLDPMDAKHFLESRGVTIPRMYDQTMQTVGEVFKYETEKQLHMTGGLPERCIGCSSRKSELRSNKDDLNHKHKFGISFQCQRGGCNEGRERFVENATRLERQNELYINLDVKTETSIESSYISSYGEMSGPIHTLSQTQITIEPSIPKYDVKGSIRVGGLTERKHEHQEEQKTLEYIMSRNAKEAQKKMELQRERERIAQEKRAAELAAAAAKDLADIEDSIELLLSQQTPDEISKRYGTVAW